jgi:hypothetical protein
MFIPYKILMSFLDPFLGAIGYGAVVRAALARTDVVAPMWHRARRHRFWRRTQLCTQNSFSLVGKE